MSATLRGPTSRRGLVLIWQAIFVPIGESGRQTAIEWPDRMAKRRTGASSNQWTRLYLDSSSWNCNGQGDNRYGQRKLPSYVIATVHNPLLLSRRALLFAMVMFDSIPFAVIIWTSTRPRLEENKQVNLQHKVKLGAFWTVLSWLGNFCLVWAV